MIHDSNETSGKINIGSNGYSENRPLLNHPSVGNTQSLESAVTTTTSTTTKTSKSYSSCSIPNQHNDENDGNLSGSNSNLNSYGNSNQNRNSFRQPYRQRRRYSFPPPSFSPRGAQRQQQQQQQSTTAGHLSPSLLPTTTTTTTLQRQVAYGRSKMDSVFSSLRSMSSREEEEAMNDSEKYLKSSLLRKAFPERFLALVVTLIIEIPTLMMISGGSSRLCFILGRSRYQLLVAFLPLASAISGNCGLQSSTLTTRGISHEHITRHNFFWGWFVYEILTGLYLGVGMGIIIGLFAFGVSGMDVSFGITIGIAQVLSIFTAGITGTSAPLLFTYIFHQDCGKWSGPIETAVQDIVGSFAMVVLSYHLLTFFGATDNIAPDDVCGEGTTY